MQKFLQNVGRTLEFPCGICYTKSFIHLINKLCLLWKIQRSMPWLFSDHPTELSNRNLQRFSVHALDFSIMLVSLLPRIVL